MSFSASEMRAVSSSALSMEGKRLGAAQQVVMESIQEAAEGAQKGVSFKRLELLPESVLTRQQFDVLREWLLTLGFTVAGDLDKLQVTWANNGYKNTMVQEGEIVLGAAHATGGHAIGLTLQLSRPTYMLVLKYRNRNGKLKDIHFKSKGDVYMCPAIYEQPPSTLKDYTTLVYYFKVPVNFVIGTFEPFYGESVRRELGMLELGYEVVVVI